MNEETELFIGGANDGRRITLLESLPIIRLPIPSDLSTSDLSENYGGIKSEEYRREILRTQKQSFEFYVARPMSIEAALARLFSHYKPND